MARLVLRWLQGDDPAASRVDEVLTTGPVMSWINVAEVYYILERRAGREQAEEVVNDLRVRARLDEATPTRTLEAARVKAMHPTALADAFAIATAQAHQAVLWTGDPEILDAQAPGRPKTSATRIDRLRGCVSNITQYDE